VDDRAAAPPGGHDYQFEEARVGVEAEAQLAWRVVAQRVGDDVLLGRPKGVIDADPVFQG
jgi:hypothetical protein